VTARMSQAVLADIASGRLSGEDALRVAVQLEGETTLGVYLGEFFAP
jgi:hypothetical protein